MEAVSLDGPVTLATVLVYEYSEQPCPANKRSEGQRPRELPSGSLRGSNASYGQKAACGFFGALLAN